MNAREFWGERRGEGFVFDCDDEGVAIVEDDSGNMNTVTTGLRREEYSSTEEFLDAVACYCFPEELGQEVTE